MQKWAGPFGFKGCSICHFAPTPESDRAPSVVGFPSRFLRASLLTLAAVLTGSLMADDWPQYRGPNHNGISTEIIRTNWDQEAPILIWKIPMDPALSSFSISGGRAFSQVRRSSDGGDHEFCVALDTATGDELWATDVGIASYPNGGVGSDDGPRSTPTVDGTNVFVVSSYLQMFCLNAATGTTVWSVDLPATYGGSVIAWQNAASPLLVGDHIFINCNAPGHRLLALNKQDGSPAWKTQDDAMTQASPVYATLAGVPQVIFFAQSGLVSVSPDTGAALWRYPFHYSVSTAASPVVSSNMVYCSAAYGVGAGAVRIGQGTGSALTATEVWRTPGASMNHWATPVQQGGYVYGVYGQDSTSLRCVSLDAGVEQWRQSGVGLGGVLMVSGVILVSTDSGDLVLVAPDPTAYTEIARITALDGSLSGQPVRCWNVPAISNGRIYVRSTLEAACFDVTPKAVSKLKLSIGSAGSGGNLNLSISAQDGSPLDPTRAAQIDLLTTPDLALGAAGWTKLPSPLTLTNGQLQLQQPPGPASPRLFFKTQEQ